MSPLSTSRCSRPLSSARSVPGLICRNRSALSAVVGATRVDDDELGARLEPVGHPQEQDRMAVGHVRADDEEQVGAVEVGVRAGRPVGAERLLVAGAGAGHAQPRVGLDVHGAQEALGQLGGQILRLDRHLAGHVERDRVGAVLVDDRAQPSARLGDRVVDRRGHRLVAARGSQQRRRQPTVVGRASSRRGWRPWCTAGRSWWDAACLRDTRAITGAPRRGSGVVSTAMPQPTPQYEHAVRVTAMVHRGGPVPECSAHVMEEN